VIPPLSSKGDTTGPAVCPNGHAMDDGLFECPACGAYRPSASGRMFTFTTTSSKPTKKVRCHNCDWTAKGNDERTFKKADAHVCEVDRA
jgi:hypothetical protein